MEQQVTRTEEGAKRRQRIATTTHSLSELVAAHPDSLRSMFERAGPVDPSELGERPRGRILCFEKGKDAFLLTRPLVRVFASDAFPWHGKTFDHGGNSGMNRVFGGSILRFRAEQAASLLDGKPALVLTYDHAPWPIRGTRDELRAIGEGIAIGPVFPGGARSPFLWFGLEADPG